MAHLAILLLSLVAAEECLGQKAISGACAAFAPDGTLATGTLKNDDLETTLEQTGAAAVTTHTTVASGSPAGRLYRCEEAFSTDGRWLATVVPAKELTIVIFDRKAGGVHKEFSSAWLRSHDIPLEFHYGLSFLAGFIPDNSVVLWRYAPHPAVNHAAGFSVELHLQRWSVDGELVSDQTLSRAEAGGPAGRRPIAGNGLGLVWIPEVCEVVCYKELKVSGTHTEDTGVLKLPKENAAEPVALPEDKGFFTVLGQRDQKAALLDLSGKVTAQTDLPFFPNLLGPLVPDWFEARGLAVSHDGEIAAIARTRIAWVLVDTDRDWGSEIVVLRMHPLSRITTLKTGKGGVLAVAVDHRNGIARLVGFWKDHWHEVQCEEHSAKCHAVGNR